MATVKEIFEAEVLKAEQHAAALRARVDAVPAEVLALSEEAWNHIKGLFGMGGPTPPTSPPPAA